MPSHLTHNKSYYGIFDKLPEGMKKQCGWLWNQYSAFAEGHDMLFYYLAQNPHKASTLIKQLKMLQDEGIQDWAIHYINFFQSTNRPLESKLFLYGYLMHHYLDAKLHPLIFYQTGDSFNDKDAQSLHLLVENMIDAYLLRKHGVDPKTFAMPTIVNSNKKLSGVTKTAIDYSFYVTYGLDDFSKIFVNYNKNLKSFLKRWRNDPHDAKKQILKPVDSILRGSFKPSILPFRFDGTEAMQYLNLDNKPWNHPLDLNNISLKSFDDLYEDGVKEIAHMISALDEAISDQAMDAELRSLMPDISANHGLEGIGSHYKLEYTKDRRGDFGEK